MDSNHFLSSEAERALMGEEEEARRLFYRDAAGRPTTGAPTQAQASYPSQQQWYPGWNPQASTMQPVASPYVVPPSPYSTGPWPQQPWQTLHPDNFDGSPQAGVHDISRSSSPNNPADLQNFGYLCADGKSWRCAHPGCTSHAVFTRGCDLRKHFRRHTKSLFCRHEYCPQSTEAGFSSKKDRDRHEAKHKPGTPCEWEGCDRIFSRVDNMKDHVRRIHRRGTWSSEHGKLADQNYLFDFFCIIARRWRLDRRVLLYISCCHFSLWFISFAVWVAVLLIAESMISIWSDQIRRLFCVANWTQFALSLENAEN